MPKIFMPCPCAHVVSFRESTEVEINSALRASALLSGTFLGLGGTSLRGVLCAKMVMSCSPSFGVALAVLGVRASACVAPSFSFCSLVSLFNVLAIVSLLFFVSSSFLFFLKYLFLRYTSLIATISHDNNNHRTSKHASTRSDGSPSCLSGSSHGWVPVKTHSTPVPTSVGRLWVAHKQHSNTQH